MQDNYNIEEVFSNKKKDSFLKKEDQEQNWFNDEYEGELSVDVYQTRDDIVIKSTIAGISPEDIDITINNDMITIRGSRHFDEKIDEDDYFFKECYWGGFSRSIILPQAVKIDKVKSTLENGILTIILPKAVAVEKVKVKVKNLKPIKKENVRNIVKN
jgi:HSP20 family protein